MYLFAFTETFRQGLEATNAIAASWDETWNKTLGIDVSGVGGQLLYNSLATVGELFAVGSLIFFSIQFFKQMQDGQWDILPQLLWSLVVASLLAGNGALLANLSIELRSFINDVNRNVLEFAVDGADIQQTFTEFQRTAGQRVIAANYFEHCEYLTGEAQRECLHEMGESVKAVLEEQEEEETQTSFGSKLLDLLTSYLTEYALTDGTGESAERFYDKLGAFFLPAWESIVFSILNGFMQAYQQFLEISLLLTTLMGPLAVGGTLLPSSPKPIFAWLIGFFSIGLGKLAFNITGGLAAVAAANANAQIDVLGDQLPLYVIFALFAPMLSAGVAVGGGLTVWSSLTGSIEAATGFVGKVIGL